MIDYKLYIKYKQEYSAQFSRIYKVYMRVLSEQTTRYINRLPMDSGDYELAISKATAQYVKELGDLKGKYALISEVERAQRGYN